MRKESTNAAAPELPSRSSGGAADGGSGAGGAGGATALAREVGEQLLNPLSSLIRKRGSGKADPHVEALQEENRKLQQIVEENMLKNRQLQDMVTKLGDEIDRLHRQRPAGRA